MHDFNLNIQETEAGGSCKFEASLVYKASPGLQDSQGRFLKNPVWENKTNQPNKQMKDS